MAGAELGGFKVLTLSLHSQLKIIQLPHVSDEGSTITCPELVLLTVHQGGVVRGDLVDEVHILCLVLFEDIPFQESGDHIITG